MAGKYCTCGARRNADGRCTANPSCTDYPRDNRRRTSPKPPREPTLTGVAAAVSRSLAARDPVYGTKTAENKARSLRGWRTRRG